MDMAEYFNKVFASNITYSSIHCPAVFPLTFLITVLTKIISYNSDV